MNLFHFQKQNLVSLYLLETEHMEIASIESAIFSSFATLA